MKLFNTLERKREKNFQVICKTFEEKGVKTVEEAQRCRSTMLSNAKTYTMFVVLLGLSLAMIFKGVASPILVGAGILLLYIWTSTYRGRELVLRYISDVLEKPEKKTEYEDRDDKESLAKTDSDD